MRLKLNFSIILALAILSLFPTRADAATVSDISKQLICQCGCNSVLLNCSHAECGTRETMTALINQDLEQGQSEEQIIQSFVASYGEQVLAAPPKKGFNLMAWIMPFVALIFGGGIIYLAIKGWLKRGRLESAIKIDEDDEYCRRLEKELSEFSERSFR